VVLETRVQGNKVIDTRSLAPGVYEAIIIMPQEITRQKLVKL